MQNINIVLQAYGGTCFVYGPGTPPKTLKYMFTDTNNELMWVKDYYKRIMRQK